MTKEEIIKAWFAIDELGGDILMMLQDIVYAGRKLHYAYIRLGMLNEFYATDIDIYKAMEQAMKKYNEYVTQNEHK